MDLKSNLPSHIGFIMDGNGRWAREKGLVRTKGHQEGLDTAKNIIKYASDIGIKFVSLYAFSTENWKRAQEEVSFLMFLIKKHLKQEYNFYRENQIRVVHSGDLKGLPEDVQKEIILVVNDTKDFKGLTVNLLINYGGRDEITRAVNKIISKNLTNITESDIQKNLDNPMIPDVDLMIRSSGEERLSNFLLWQCAYSEFYYSNVLWPDFSVDDFNKALEAYNKRTRRFGGIK
ncbi:di-trans,poly-cis-decaprenylcistransferase [Thiospirochaeta perfilievii]|uniref:Isoprenyl transferase n=1 Tax=Thiospirochaeta perfilievii TaxID=252967 RepID=A0A5C1QFD9_9SPIO|nr:polyprenyl diphosphate synthase [Thiospirochaeta perfilievii]QEN06128.1 di-trans,poly-cis-decaprenylcistransferase [Thiospirochaeta perfilievii]